MVEGGILVDERVGTPGTGVPVGEKLVSVLESTDDENNGGSSDVEENSSTMLVVGLLIAASVELGISSGLVVSGESEIKTSDGSVMGSDIMVVSVNMAEPDDFVTVSVMVTLSIVDLSISPVAVISARVEDCSILVSVGNSDDKVLPSPDDPVSLRI